MTRDDIMTRLEQDFQRRSTSEAFRKLSMLRQAAMNQNDRKWIEYLKELTDEQFAEVYPEVNDG